MLEVIVANKVIILGFLLALSEVLALIPSIKANSVFQILVNAIKKVAGK